MTDSFAAPITPSAPPVGWQRFVGAGTAFAVALLALVWGVLGPGIGMIAAVVFYAGALGLAGRSFAARYPHGQIGLCNLVTMGRLALCAVLFGALVVAAPVVPILLALACVTFALDGADGWLARRSGLTSDFGARFDVEVDSVFALILAALAVQNGLHPLVLLLGLPRYGFWLALQVWPKLRAPLAERFGRKVVCVVQIAALIVLTIPALDPGLRHVLAALTGGLVLWSFAVDIRALLRAPS